MPMIAAVVAAPAIGGIVGNILGSSDRESARANMAQALNAIISTGAPPDMAKALLLDKFKSAGVLTPALEADLGDVSSNLANYKEDSNLKNSQMDALNALAQQSKTGLSATDQVALNQIRGKAMTDAEAQRQAVMQQMQSRGMGGSGAELISQLSAGQNASNQEANQGLSVAAQAQQAALNALMNRGQLAGSMRSQDLNTAQATMGAADAMAKFNMQNSMGRQAANTGILNQAQAANLQNAQNLSNMNTSQQNNEAQRQANAEHQKWVDTLNLNAAKSNALTGNATQLSNQANQTGAMWSGIGSAVGAGLNAYNNYSKKAPSSPSTPAEDTPDDSGSQIISNYWNNNPYK